MADVINLKGKKLAARQFAPEGGTPAKVRKPWLPARGVPQALPPVERAPLPPAPVASPIAWHAPAAYHDRRVGGTVVIIAAVSVAAGAFLLWRRELFGGAALCIAGIWLIFAQRHEPRHYEVVVSTAGVRVGDATFQWRDIKSFWIDYSPGGVQELSLETSRWYHPYVRVLLASQDPVQLRKAMIPFVQEKEHPASLIDFWSKRY